jgi:hypothetical protein
VRVDTELKELLDLLERESELFGMADKANAAHDVGRILPVA